MQEEADGIYFVAPHDKSHRIFLKTSAIQGWKFKTAYQEPEIPAFNPWEED